MLKKETHLNASTAQAVIALCQGLSTFLAAWYVCVFQQSTCLASQLCTVPLDTAFRAGIRLKGPSFWCHTLQPLQTQQALEQEHDYQACPLGQGCWGSSQGCQQH